MSNLTIFLLLSLTVFVESIPHTKTDELESEKQLADTDNAEPSHAESDLEDLPRSDESKSNNLSLMNFSEDKF